MDDGEWEDWDGWRPDGQGPVSDDETVGLPAVETTAVMPQVSPVDTREWSDEDDAAIIEMELASKNPYLDLLGEVDEAGRRPWRALVLTGLVVLLVAGILVGAVAGGGLWHPTVVSPSAPVPSTATVTTTATATATTTPTPTPTSTPTPTPTPVPSTTAPPPETTTAPPPPPETTAPPAPVADNCPNGDYTGDRYDGACGQPPVAQPQPDNCPNGDYTGNRYDGACGSAPVAPPPPPVAAAAELASFSCVRSGTKVVASASWTSNIKQGGSVSIGGKVQSFGGGISSTSASASNSTWAGPITCVLSWDGRSASAVSS